VISLAPAGAQLLWGTRRAEGGRRREGLEKTVESMINLDAAAPADSQQLTRFNKV